jgi:formate hydrogenlyase subunit 3/multisubunit Na+/H+ antiporter MnhD subunit
MLLGIGVGITFLQADAMAGAFFHLLTHMLMKGLAFLCAGALLYALFLSRGKHGSLAISDLNGAAGKYPLVAGAFSIALLGLGGLPPLAGFMSKWQIFIGSAQTLNGWVVALVAFAALNSVLSLAYYAPLVNAMYRKQPSDAVRDGGSVALAMSVPLALMAAAVIVLGVLPALVSPLTSSAAAALVHLGGVGMIP